MKTKRLLLMFILFVLGGVPLFAQYTVDITLELWAWQINGAEMEAPWFNDTLGGMVATLKYNGSKIDPSGYTCTWYRDWNEPDRFEWYRDGFRGGRHGVSCGVGYTIKAVVTKNSDPSFWVENSMYVEAPVVSQRTEFYLNSRLESGQAATDNTIYFWASPSWNYGKGLSGTEDTTNNYRYFTIGSEAALKTDPNFRSDVGQKFRWWNRSNGFLYYLNHQELWMSTDARYTTSWYKQTTGGTTISATLIDNPSSPINIDFLDPWSQDYADPSYGNSIRNRGLEADFLPITSSTANNTGFSTPHEGVFLLENPQFDNTKPIYYVRAPLTKMIGSTNSYFLSWDYDVNKAQLAELQTTAGHDQKAVVFKQSGATITARYISSTITSNTTIPAGTHRLAGTLTVAAGATLTISAGATLQFPAGADLAVYGKLIADGTNGVITFTSTGGTSSGSWGSIILQGWGANGSNLNNVHVSYGTDIRVTSVGSFIIQNSVIDTMVNGVNSTYASNGWVVSNQIRYPRGPWHRGAKCLYDSLLPQHN
jgi:hypothetical protein